MLRCRVLLLDDTYIERELEKNAVGQVLFDKVCEYLNLLERDYFGLASWESSNTKVWLDVSKEVRKQVINQQATFSFNVKFYPPDPSLLAEDITRYLLCLQLRMDIMTGRLPCPSDTLAVLGSYTIQSEFGDYDPDLHGQDFLTNIPLAPDQTPELEEKVKELHCTHECMSPAQADKLFLQTARMLPLYGVHLHPAKDVNGTEVMLGVCADGLLVYEDGENTESFPWPRVLKMSYKRNNFHGRIRRTQDSSESTIRYGLPNYRACKCLWKNAVEHHAFFRNHRPDKATEGLLHFGSRYRLRGLTYDEALEASADISREALRFSHSAIKRKAKDSMFVALKRPNWTEVDDWFQILASDQWPTYQETLDVEPDAVAKTEIDSRKYTHKEVMKESDLDEENTWFELLGGHSSSIQLPLPSVSDTLDRAVLNSWKQSDDDWFVLLEPKTLYSKLLPGKTPLSGEGIEWEEVTTEENVKVVNIRKGVQTLRKGHEELEFEPRPDIVRELDTEIKHQITQITEEKLEEHGNGDKLQKVFVFQQRTLEEEKYMGRPQEVSTEQQIRRVEIVKKTLETVSEGSEIISEGTIEELQKRLLEVEAIEQNLQDIEMLDLGLQKLQAWQRQVELQGRQRGEIDDWYLLLDRKQEVAYSALGELEEIESQIPEQPVVEEVQIMEHEQKLEEEETRQVKESTQFKIQEQSWKEEDDGWFALSDVSSKGTVPSRVVYDQEVTREEAGPVMEKVTSVKTLIYEETLERRGGMVETYSEVVQKIPVVRHETDDWFVLLEPKSYETRIIPSVPVVEDYEDTVTVQEKKESVEEKPVIMKEVQTKARESGEVKMNIPVGTREVDDTWFLHFDPTPFEKRNVATDWLVPVPLTELYEETVGLRTQQKLTVKEKEVTTAEKHVIVREVQMKTGEVEKKNPVVRREVDDSWFVLFDQTPVEKRHIATAPVTEVYEDTAGLRTQQRVTIKREEIITDERRVILTEKRAIAGEAEKKLPVSRREVDDSWFVLFDPIPFEKRRVATAELLQEERAAWRKRKVEDKRIIHVKESDLSDTLISRETRLVEVHERRVREEDRRKREVELRRPPRLPLLRAVEHHREVEDDWHVLLEVQPKKSVPIVSPVDVHKSRPQPPADQPLTSTPTAQPVRITGPSYQDESLTRLTITQDVTQDISQESKMETESVILRKRREREIKGETIFVRHSILMLEGFDETQEVVLRHHASISELKRLFMEDVPICVPTEWEKRLSTHTPVIIPWLTNGDLVLA